MVVGTVSAAPGDTIYVNDTGGNDNFDGSSWENAKKTIKNATGSVNENGVVNIANGQYSGTDNTQIIINRNMVISGQSQEGTIIDGTNSNQIFTVNPGITLILQDLTLTNGYMLGNGGAINNQGDLIINNCIIDNNTATQYGGGIYNHDGTLTITNSVIQNNNLIGDEITGDERAEGAGIYNNAGTLNLTNSIIQGNTITLFDEGLGGGICSNAGSLTIINSTIQGNIIEPILAGAGAGICIKEGTITITNCKIQNNTIEEPEVEIGNAEGGGIYNNNGDMVITNSIIKGNYAASFAGGIFNGGNVNIKNTSIADNYADTGGAIRNHGYASMDIDNSIIQKNFANGAGAILNTAIMNITNTLIDQNTAAESGAIRNRGDGTTDEGVITITDSTITGNTAFSDGIIRNNMGIISITGSLIQQNIFNDETDNGVIFNDANGKVTVNFNRIVGNSNSTIYNQYGTVDARFNWWGSNNPNYDTLISGEDVTYTPWIYMNFNAGSLNVKQGDQVPLTASFNYLYDGNSITPLDPNTGHIPDNTPVTFTTTLGEVGSSSVVKYTINGLATAILRATQTGTAIVAAVADDEILSTSIKVNAVSGSKTVSAKTIGMQTTGAPLAGIILAIFMVMGGLITARRK